MHALKNENEKKNRNNFNKKISTNTPVAECRKAHLHQNFVNLSKQKKIFKMPSTS